MIWNLLSKMFVKSFCYETIRVFLFDVYIFITACTKINLAVYTFKKTNKKKIVQCFKFYIKSLFCLNSKISRVSAELNNL